LELFRFCRKNELFNEIIEDQFANWEDDKSLIIGTIKKVLKSLPSENENFIMEHYPDDETCKEYGEFLLLKTYLEDEALLKLIEPVLQNWDADRVAVLDMIMIKMAICEFLYCNTIPAKVTLNEYVELAKSYSTSKSKEFVNGILDKLLNDLKSKNLIIKEGRGLMDE
jgi:N utilization substance protein B